MPALISCGMKSNLHRICCLAAPVAIVWKYSIPLNQWGFVEAVGAMLAVALLYLPCAGVVTCLFYLGRPERPAP